MAFSREDLTAYASQPQTQIDKFDPFNPDPQVKAEASQDPSPEDVPELPEEVLDGSTTETEAESVAATDANPEGEKSPELDDLADGKHRSRAQERIEELVAERNALRRYGEYLLTQVDGQRKSTQAAPPVAPTEVSDDSAPTLESAEFDPVKLNKLQNEWIQKQVNKRVESAVAQIETRQSETAVRQAFESRVTEFRKKTPDFDTILANPALPQLAPEAAKVVVRSEQGPELAYYLGRNPDIAERIARMEPFSQVAAIGRLEGQLSKPAQKEPSKTSKPASVTKAPPPPKPVSGGSGIVQKDQALMSMEDWVSHERNKKVADQANRKKIRLAMR